MGDNELSSRPGIGNYKGVMLCNRPFAGVSAAAKQAYSTTRNSPAPFLSTCQNREPLGLNPVKQAPVLVEEKPKKDNALSKHKRFLSELNKQKKQLEQEMEDKRQADEERHRRFKEKLQQQRQEVVKERRSEEEKIREDEPYSESKHAEVARDNQEEKAPEKKSNKKLVKKSMPKWALTKEAVDELEDIEADELVDFAKDLDFDSYLEDLEVQAALKAAKSRIEDLKKSESKSDEGCESKAGDWDDLLDDDDRVSIGSSVVSGSSSWYEGKSRKKRSSKSSGDWNSSTKLGNEEGKEDEVESVASARSFLSDISSSSIKSLRHIHSARSLSKIADKVRAANPFAPIDEDAASIQYSDPVIVSISEDDHARLKQKDAINKLPYMNRNPAV